VREADVRIVYDSRADDPGRASYQAMAANGLIPGVADPLDPARPDFPRPSPDDPNPEPLVKGRRTNPSFLSHNKFIVLLRDGEPVEVWTGSTNVTTGGIFGQSNVGHIVRDPAVAAAYLAYWQRLFADPQASALRKQDVAATPDPVGLPLAGVTAVFSPRPTRVSAGRTVLDWYADRMAEATQSVCFTAAFGVNQVLRDVLITDVGFLRYVLLDTRNKQEMEVIGKDRDNLIAYGALIDKDTYGQWLHEQLLRDGTGREVNLHVKYVHTKYMLVDPLTEDPIVITGSANFSDASTEQNDENMLVIRGDQHVADIYLGEFMRLFHHLYFRDLIERVSQGTNAYLQPDDSWTTPYFDPGTDRFKERVLFSGTQRSVSPDADVPPPPAPGP
jgi:phosphatidylserine/phosphatidylglycerophosphate/cardiolipin synthase-like enzyme